MIFLIKLVFSIIFYSHMLTVLIVFTPKITLASAADGKAMEGVEFYQKQKFNQASRKFLEAHQGKPNDAKISYNLGNSQYKQGNYEQALQSYSKSTKEKINSSINQKLNYNLGNTFFRMNKLKESVAAFKKALKLDPNDMDAKFNLEFVREQLKKKKQNQDSSKKNKNTTDKKNKSDNKSKHKSSLSQETPDTKKKEKQKEVKNQAPQEDEVAQKKIKKGQAEQMLGLLTEDLKKFQKKQALEMKSLFTYRGKDW